jgi:tripartite-type tricarboxylate transporter receptor subunit TctC
MLAFCRTVDNLAPTDRAIPVRIKGEDKMSTIRVLASAALATVAGLSFTAGAFAAEDVASFYKGKRITMIVGSGPGGGYDTYARLVARHMGRHIPGNPGFITQNKSGAGGIIAANFVANVAPKDGTVIGGMQRAIALIQIMGQKGTKYKSEELNWLGSLAKEAGVCALATRTGAKSLDAVFKKQFTMGGTGPNTTEFWPALFRNLMAAKFKLIRGYPATPQIHLAIARGELDGVCQSWASFSVQAKAMLKAGTIKPLVQVSLHPDPEMTKLGVPMLQDFLTADNLAAGQNLEDVKLFFKLTIIPPVMGRPYAMAPGIPKARVDAMRKAFIDMTKDPLFLKDAERLGRDIEVVTGEEIQAIIADIAKTPKDKLAALKGHFKFKGPVEKVKLAIVKHMGKVVKIKRGGRRITIDYGGKKRTAKVSGSKTKVSINGNKAKRKAVKVGMTCEFHYYGNKTTAKKLVCKN